MGIIRRYRTALSRHHRSKGFGIHSPFAFMFVRTVLRERLPYYSYEQIEQLRHTVSSGRKHPWGQPHLITAKGAKMLFRIVNYFNPKCMMQIGTNYGVSSACMLAVSSSSHLTVYQPDLEQRQFASRVYAAVGDNVDCFYDLGAAMDRYNEELGSTGGKPFLLVNHIPQSRDFDMLTGWLRQLVAAECVVVFRNLVRDQGVKRLWECVRATMPHGQTFFNEKTGIIVANPKLQREDFFLWF
ncbi:MAG: hypothetical protein KBT10_06050 [Bacteroidales bacterium]|nr:hypothetical protein [Candidatus Sodaliphilus aphodohippi]